MPRTAPGTIRLTTWLSMGMGVLIVFVLLVALGVLNEGSQGHPVGLPTSEPSPTVPVTATGTSSIPDETDPVSGGSYALVELNASVKLTSIKRYLDLDSPRAVNQDDLAEVAFTGGAEPSLSFRFGDVALAKTPDVGPAECAANIRLTPADQTVFAKADLVLCAVSDGREAVGGPDGRRIARIVVRSASDRSLELTVTTWRIPE